MTATQTQHIKPLGSRVLVKRHEQQKQKGSILLPETAQEKPRQATVIAIGPGKVDEKGNVKKVNVQVGDIVLLSSYAGTEVKLHEEGDFLIVSDDDILGVLV